MKAQCPNCKKTFDIQNEHLGVLVSCPHCDAPIQIPALTAKIIMPYQYNPDVTSISRAVFFGMLMFSLIAAVVSVIVFILVDILRHI